MTDHDMTFMRDHLVRRLGPSARPSGAIRMLKCGAEERLQAEFFNELGVNAWVDVPVVKVDSMPPKDFPSSKAETRAARRASK